MSFFIHTHEHGQSNGIVFLLGAILNILANTDFSNFLDYTLKALIGRRNFQASFNPDINLS